MNVINGELLLPLLLMLQWTIQPNEAQGLPIFWFVNHFTDILYNSLAEESACRKPLPTQDNKNTEKHRYTSMLQVLFRPITLVTKQLNTVHALHGLISNKQHTFIEPSGIMLHALVKYLQKNMNTAPHIFLNWY